MDATQRAHLIHNLAVHMCNIKSKAITERQLSVFAAVDEDFAAKLAKELGVSGGAVKKMEVKKAGEAVRFKANLKAL